MLKIILSKIIAKAKNDPQFKIDYRWGNIDIVSVFLDMSIAYIRGLYWSMRFKASGKYILIKKNVRIINPRFIKTGNSLILEHGCEIQGISQNGIVFGNKVAVGSHTIIKQTNPYGGALGVGLKIGNFSHIGPFSFIGCSGGVEIGNNVMVGPHFSLHSENIYLIPLIFQSETKE
jgi:acetyltransferase-like isoleucine patch superfamily enzyme